MGLKIVYLGTPSFAVPTLHALAESGHQVIEVITQPDRPKGRHQTVTPSPVKLAAEAWNLPIYQPERIRRPEAIQHLRDLAPDIMVVVGYGQIIPQTVIDIPPRGIINVHASLLPKLRGAAPIQWAIANGEKVTGVTTMRIDAGLDTGAMLLKAETPIDPDENAIELSERLAPLGAALLIATLAEDPPPQPQNPAEATLAPILTKADGRLDWSQPARQVHDRIRGMQPWPCGHTSFRGQALQIWKSRIAPGEHQFPAGRIFPEAPLVACGHGSLLEILELQLEGRKRVAARALWNGLRLTDNEYLGAAPL